MQKLVEAIKRNPAFKVVAYLTMADIAVTAILAWIIFQ